MDDGKFPLSHFKRVRAGMRLNLVRKHLVEAQDFDVVDVMKHNLGNAT